jgi:hypothetical protein
MRRAPPSIFAFAFAARSARHAVALEQRAKDYQ